MSMTQVQPVEVFPNTSAAILAYLARRTMDTVGDQVRRAGAVVVGVSGETDVYPIPGGHKADTGSLFVTSWTAEHWLVGQGEGQPLFYLVAIDPHEVVTGGTATGLVSSGQRALLFLSGPRHDAAVTALPLPAYSLAPGEGSLQLLQEETFDGRGRPVTEDRSAQVAAIQEAVEWYIALPEADVAGSALRRKALLAALDHTNPHIAHCAVRSLAQPGDEQMAKAFRQRLPAASDPHYQIDLLVGLWLTAAQIGEAEAALEQLMRSRRRSRWLAAWDIHATSAGRGRRPQSLYAPQPPSLPAMNTG